MKHLHKVPQGTTSVAAFYKATQESLSEQEILAFHSYLFSPGFHCIKVPSIAAGRGLLEEYASSCAYVIDSAFLSMTPAPNGHRNLYEELCVMDAFSEEGRLEEFILCSLTQEFLIIEATAELLKTPWFGKFEQLLIDYNIMKETTIIMFLY